MKGFLVAALALAAYGVSQELYDQRTTELDRCRSELTRTQGDLTGARTHSDELNLDKSRLSDENLALRIEHDKLAGEHLRATQREMLDLRRVHEQAELRYEVYRTLAARLGKLVEARALTVEKLENRKIVLRLPDDQLFDAGKAELKMGAVATLHQVAGALKEISDRDFLVGGHTDNVSVRSAAFKSNWDLSAARAVAVVRFFQSEGVDPRHLAAAGFSEFGAVVENEGADARARNRRIEIVVMPRLDELPSLYEPTDGGAAPSSDGAVTPAGAAPALPSP